MAKFALSTFPEPLLLLYAQCSHHVRKWLRSPFPRSGKGLVDVGAFLVRGMWGMRPSSPTPIPSAPLPPPQPEPQVASRDHRLSIQHGPVRSPKRHLRRMPGPRGVVLAAASKVHQLILLTWSEEGGRR